MCIQSICLNLFLSLSLSLSIYIYIYIPVCSYLSIDSPPVCSYLTINPSNYLSQSVHIYRYIYLSLFLYPASLSLSLYIYIYIYISVFRSINTYISDCSYQFINLKNYLFISLSLSLSLSLHTHTHTHARITHFVLNSSLNLSLLRSIYISHGSHSFNSVHIYLSIYLSFVLSVYPTLFRSADILISVSSYLSIYQNLNNDNNFPGVQKTIALIKSGSKHLYGK